MVPYTGLNEWDPAPNSGVFVFPSATPPAAFTRDTSSESAAELVQRYVRYGSSPRGGQAMTLGAKVNALLDGRYNVSFDDIKAVAPAALRHRLILNFEGQADGIHPTAEAQPRIMQNVWTGLEPLLQESAAPIHAP